MRMRILDLIPIPLAIVALCCGCGGESADPAAMGEAGAASEPRCAAGYPLAYSYAVPTNRPDCMASSADGKHWCCPYPALPVAPKPNCTLLDGSPLCRTEQPNAYSCAEAEQPDGCVLWDSSGASTDYTLCCPDGVNP